MHGMILQKSWISYKTIYANVDMKNSVVAVHAQWQSVSASISAAEMVFVNRLSFLEMNGATIARNVQIVQGTFRSTEK